MIAPAATLAALTLSLSSLDAIVLRGIAEQRYPGAVLLVGQRGKTLYAKAFGRHTYDADSTPVRLDTVFDLASLTKVTAGTPAALLLIEDGRLALDDRVAWHLPGFAANGKGDVTMRDLLTHVSGLKAYESFASVEKDRRSGETAYEALYRRYSGLPLAYPPRSKVLYSCINLQTVAAVVQSASGEALEELLRRRIWAPLGMRDTTYRPSTRQKARCAPTGVTADGAPERGVVHDPLARYHGSDRLCPGNAGLFSTAVDLERYARALLNEGAWRGKRVLRPESVGLMTSVHTPPGIAPRRSIGWVVYDGPPFAPRLDAAAGVRYIGHTGYTGTWLWLDTVTDTYIVFLSNRVYPSPASDGGEGGSIDGLRGEIAQAVVAFVASRTGQ